MVDINCKRVLIWGTGGYCAEKIDYITKVATIVGFVDRKEIVFRGKTTITPDRILDIDFEYIIVLSYSYFEIMKDIISYGIKADRIIPGIAVSPLLFDEVDLMTKETDVRVSDGGELIYCFQNKTYVIKCHDDWGKIRALILDSSNDKRIRDISCRPVGKKWGNDRGGSIVRYYLDDFFEKNKTFISGNVLEIGDRNYTGKYGKQTESYVLHYANKDKGSKFEICGDLVSGEGLQEDFYDCIILTQVLAFVPDVFSAVNNITKALKTGGHILITDCGITPIGCYEMERYGHFWSFTTKSFDYLFDEKIFEKNIVSYGNVKAACAFLMGMSCCDVDKRDLDYFDEDYQIVVAANIKKMMH